MKTLRRDFVESLPGEEVARFKFVDETSVKLAGTCRYGWAVGSRRVDAALLLHKKENEGNSCLSAPGLDAVMDLDGTVNRASFAAHPGQMLRATLQAGEVVLGDLRVYKTAARVGSVETCGARRLYLPSYLLDFIAIELVFSKLKTYLRAAAARTR